MFLKARTASGATCVLAAFFSFFPICHRKDLLPQRKSGDAGPMQGSLGGVCDQGEGTAGGNPIDHGCAVSDQQVCLAQETPAGLVFVELGEVSLDKQAFSWIKQKTSRTRATFAALLTVCVSNS